MGNLPTQSGGICSRGDPLDPLPDYVRERKGKRVIRRILIANNGMAATKAIMSMRKWTFEEFGSERLLTFIAMATQDDLDAHAEFVRLADAFVEVPAGKNVNNYANVNLICEVAKEKQVDAVWPGWGHASENPRLPAQLKEIGVTFIGPTSSVMSALGDKIAANILAQTAQVPSIPWSGDGLTATLTAEGTVPEEVFNKAMVTELEDALQRAEKIGYPVMVKASEGGGGKGIRRAANAAELRTAFTNVQTEVPGSPIFMMQVCSEARHLEVQILGDEHGNTLALNGRDCSTQRRFQKIFEEGPPVIATSATFKEMERAAQRLTALVGYRGAGTVEYLYNAAEDNFFFLELNPRLQVEHPVTEGITGVNLPAAQLQIAMGIPLYAIPDIRRFYGLDPAETGRINFMSTDYPPIRSHVVASRITAENPDEAFKPTSGKIHSIRFQSSSDCWGYFSVGLNGGIHEFADSQFGHVFARGPNRNAARKSLLLALKNIDIVGEIRHPVSYLIELLETEDFRSNAIDTMWLDRLIAAKLIRPSRQTLDVVFLAAVYKAHQIVKRRTDDMLASVQKGQLVLLGRGDTSALVTFPVEITYDGKKFSFQVSRVSEGTFDFTICTSKLRAKVREQPDGSIYALAGGSTQLLKGKDEALGLRLVIGSTTFMLPTIYDPSELRSDVNGKVVRYLHDDGAEVAKGQPYVELEAMKMVMALKAGEAGKISHTKSPGSVVAAGELLASLQLKDPSKVEKIEPFDGEFQCCGQQGAGDETEHCEESLGALLDGFAIGTKGPVLVEQLFSGFANAEAAARSVQRLLERYLKVERRFAASILNKQPYDEMLRELISEHRDVPQNVLKVMQAHNRLPERNETILAVVREMVASEGSGMSCMYVPDLQTEQDMDAGVHAKVMELSKMPTEAAAAGDFGSVRHLAQQLLHVVPSESHFQRLRQQLNDADEATLLAEDSRLGVSEDGGLELELLVELLSDSEAVVQRRAVHAYLHLLCMPSRVAQLDLRSLSGGCMATWTQQGHTPSHGLLLVVKDLDSVEGLLTQETMAPLTQRVAASDKDLPNSLHLVIGRDAFPQVKDRTRFHNSEEPLGELLPILARSIGKAGQALRAARVGEVCVVLPQPPRHPRLVSYCVGVDVGDWAERRPARDLWPSFAALLELQELDATYTLQRIHKEVRPTSHIYLATRPAVDGHRAPLPDLFLRSLNYAKVSADSFVGCLTESLLLCMEELEHAMLDPRVARHGPAVKTHIFLRLLAPLCLQADDVMQLFQEALASHVGAHGAEMLKLCIDEIEVKVQRTDHGQAPDTAGETLRLSSSSLRGGYMKMRMLHERPDGVTAGPETFKKPGSRTLRKLPSENSDLDPTAANQIQTKRATARRSGSTYAYDLPGLLKVALASKWAVGQGLAASPTSRPTSTLLGSETVGARKSQGLSPRSGRAQHELLTARELVLRPGNSQLEEVHRPEGKNDVGMVAWKITMQTPEYPDGRDIVLIANDLTFQAGSFGVREDEFFQLASAYARSKGIPRIYVSCNSGARVGLVEELKPLYKVKWLDPEDPCKGFDYIYLTPDSMKKLGPGTVSVREVKEGKEKRFIIDSIIGQGQASTKGGIGVENLQGSGLIAGETSRAYRETFTLSYTTGRAVGIGAYLNRLGQRNIQMVSSPMILTGYNTLNKVLGKNVYSSHDQLGGPQVMVPNGVTHQVVSNDQEGMSAILDWLSYVPRDVNSLPPIRQLCSDPWDRDVEFVPSRQPYDPRDFLRGAAGPNGTHLRGFFDAGTFREYLEGWGRSVVVGRARLGGIPMGVIAVETRSVQRTVPADPANSESAEVVEPQAGQVWFPDSAFKTAQALRDFNRGENLPVMIFANWRGFSGGTRDMYNEILKYGAQIVDALVEYEHPIFVYIPPNGELRGGAWVVIDPKINPDKMEMYADVESRGGILEPPGIVEVKYRGPQQVQSMHRQDERLRELDEQLQSAAVGKKEPIEQAIRARERQLLPLYTSIAEHFADLHDRSSRMQAVGVVRSSLKWKDSRRFFFWRVKRRLLEDQIVRKLLQVNPRLSNTEALQTIQGWAEEAKVEAGSDEQMAKWLELQNFEARVRSARTPYIKAEMEALLNELPERERCNMLRAAAAGARRGESACNLM